MLLLSTTGIDIGYGKVISDLKFPVQLCFWLHSKNLNHIAKLNNNDICNLAPPSLFKSNWRKRVCLHECIIMKQFGINRNT